MLDGLWVCGGSGVWSGRFGGSVLAADGLWVCGGSGVMVEGCPRAAVVGQLLVVAFPQEEPQGHLWRGDPLGLKTMMGAPLWLKQWAPLGLKLCAPGGGGGFWCGDGGRWRRLQQGGSILAAAPWWWRLWRCGGVVVVAAP